MKTFGNVLYRDVSICTWANGVTALRTILCLVLFSVAAYAQDERLNLIGLGVFWLLDNVDGFLARKLDQETIFGAQFDILSDRLSFAFFYMNYLTFHRDLTVVIVLFMVNFILLDHYLSIQFLRLPLISPNYFYEVDPVVWRLNWSPPGKFCNSGLVTILMIGTGRVALPLICLVGLLLVKVYSGVRMHSLSKMSSEHVLPGVIRLRRSVLFEDR